VRVNSFPPLSPTTTTTTLPKGFFYIKSERVREEIKTQGKRNGNAFFSVLSCVVSFLKIVELTVVLKKEKQNKTKQKI
jgi:hypothetical protein